MTPFTKGIHQIPEAQYFGIKAASSTLLKEMKKSPAHAYNFLNRDPEQEASDEKRKALRQGKLIERAILEPHRIKGLPVKPKGMSFATTEGKAWRAAHANSEILTSEEDAMLKAIAANVNADPDISAILRAGGQVQPSLFAIDEETGIPLKSRLDWLSKGNFILDIKSTVTADPDTHGFPREIAKFAYHIQAAFYLDMCARLGMPKEVFVFLAVEKKPPYVVTPIQLDRLSINKGRSEYRRLLLKYKECVEANSWPFYSRGIQIVTISDWSLREQEYESAEAYELHAT
jgi:hypothetical protein